MLNKLEDIRKTRKSGESGFTIIEVMIVLAIAGLILLIVLLAIPALQRNSRNTSIKNDAAAIIAGISEFSSNNDGVQPNAAGSSQAGAVITIGRTPGTTANTTATVQGSTVYGEGTGAGNVPQQTAGSVYVRYGAQCPAAVPLTGTVPVTAQTRSSVVVYVVERGGGATQNRCVGS